MERRNFLVSVLAALGLGRFVEERPRVSATTQLQLLETQNRWFTATDVLRSRKDGAYSLGFSVSKDLLNDDFYEQLRAMSRHIARQTALANERVLRV